MQIAIKNARLIPAQLKKLFGSTSPIHPLFVKGTEQSISSVNGNFVIGLEKSVNVDNPLKGSIYFKSTHKRQYYAAMGRSEDGTIDYSILDIIEKCKSILSQTIASNEEMTMVLDSICKMQGKAVTPSSIICNVAESISDLSKIDQVILGNLYQCDVPHDFRNFCDWVQSIIKSNMKRAYLESNRSLFWLLDYHRFGEEPYSIARTYEQGIGTECEIAVWVPNEDLYIDIDIQSHATKMSQYDIALSVLKDNLSAYNAFLKKQVFDVVQYEYVKDDNEYIEVSRSNPIYGLIAAQNHIKSKVNDQKF